MSHEATCQFRLYDDERNYDDSSDGMVDCGRPAAQHCMDTVGCRCGGVHTHRFVGEQEPPW